MDSNTAYHFSRLLETTPYLGHCWRVVKMERYRVCAARRKKREKNFRETRIVTRHRATARPYYVPRASNFTRASLRDVSLPFPFFFIISLQGKAFHDAQTSLPRGTDGGDRSAETISLALRFPRRASNPPNRPRILEHAIVRCARPTGGIGRNAWMMAERISAGHGLLLIDFTGSATPRIITSESWYQTRASNRPIHSINYDRSGIIRRLIPIGSPSARDGGDSTAIAASIHPVVSRDTFRGAGTIRVTDRNWILSLEDACRAHVCIITTAARQRDN